MSDTLRAPNPGLLKAAPPSQASLRSLWGSVWKHGLLASVTLAATAAITIGLPDVVPWGSAGCSPPSPARQR